MESDLIPQREFARKFGEYVRRQPYALITLKRWAREGRGPQPIKIGNAVVYSWSAAMKWVDEQVKAA